MMLAALYEMPHRFLKSLRWSGAQPRFWPTWCPPRHRVMAQLQAVRQAMPVSD